MKPIEIHIEGYKIVISKDEDGDESITYMPKGKDDGLVDLPNLPHTVPCPYVPQNYRFVIGRNWERGTDENA